jgi:hypothetical protein
MATTTNYGWTTPDDTALVKDGAAAIRTLGSSVDTTTKNLNPETTLGDISYRSSSANVNTRLPLGTAGQVLKVNSGATAPEWATDASGMTNPMTTTGDTIYSSSGSTPARLAIGSTGQVLTVAGGVPSWATPGGGAGITLIDELAFSASQTINVNDVFSSTYKNYRVFITGTSTSSNPLTMRLRLSGTDTSTDYTNQSLIVDATSTTARRNYTGNDDWQLGDINADAATFEISIFNPNIADKTGYSCTNGLLLSSINNLTESFTGFQTAGTQFTGFTLLSASNATGTVLVYGFAKE